MISKLAVAFVAAHLPIAAFAQTAAVASPSVAPLVASAADVATTPPVPSIAAPAQAVLRAQTPVQLRLSEFLTTKKKALRVGQRFQMEVAEALSVNGVVVVPVGTPATGEITEVRNKGMWGKSGYIGARVVNMRVGDRTIRLSASFDDKGVTGTGGVVAAIAFLPVAGFFTTGTSAQIPLGAQIKAFVDEDVPLAFNATMPSPLPVATPAGPMPVAGAVPAGASATPAAVVSTPK